MLKTRCEVEEKVSKEKGTKYYVVKVYIIVPSGKEYLICNHFADTDKVELCLDLYNAYKGDK